MSEKMSDEIKKIMLESLKEAKEMFDEAGIPLDARAIVELAIRLAGWKFSEN